MTFRIATLLMLLVLAGCGGPTTVMETEQEKSAVATRQRGATGTANDVVIYALGLMDTKYRFGGRNPDAGFDCSGMVSYVFRKAAGVHLTGSAASMARKGRAVSSRNMKPGDLVFFNTQHRPHSHVGIYLGDGRFIHAPSSRGRAKVRTDSLREGYFARRFEGARRYLD